MERLMIVDDDPIVRQELVRLVKQCSVPVKDIIECNNGRDAFELLRTMAADLVITDIHMPKMNGCELTEAIFDMELPGRLLRPKVVIISGFENFQCAVELLKYGARDYIIKPATQEGVEDVLRRMEIEIIREKKRLEEIDRVYRQHVRHLLTNGGTVNDEEWNIVLNTFEFGSIAGKPYRLVLTNPSGEAERIPGPCLFFLDKIGGDLYLIEESQTGIWKKLTSDRFCMGISQVHDSVCELAEAYMEALEARKSAFILCSPLEEYRKKEWEHELNLSGEMETFRMLFLTNRIDDAKRHFRALYYEACQQRLCPARLEDLTEAISGWLLKDYGHVLDSETELVNREAPLESIHIKSYMNTFEQWVRRCRKSEKLYAGSTRRDAKLMQALEFIHRNYHKDINLAIVSNHVSMNYSVFSHVFRLYTGVSFVQYLRELRMTEAKRLLETTDKKILEIGAQVGYGNDKHFMKAFKEFCGVSPTEYRKQWPPVPKTVQETG